MRGFAFAITAFAMSGLSGGAQAQQITVNEDEIVSLAGAPEILEASALVDQAGRPVLAMTLRFANSCYADVGARVLAAQTAGGPPHAIVTREISPEGCMEIFQPVERHVAALLPGRMTSAELRLIGKPATDGPVRSLAFSPGDAPPDATIIEARDLGTLPKLEIGAVSPAAGGGYVLTASTALSAACAGQLSATLFEVPDADGTPRYDVVLVTAPQDCGAGAMRTVEIRAATPQPPRGRAVYVVNDAAPTPRPIAQ